MCPIFQEAPQSTAARPQNSCSKHSVCCPSSFRREAGCVAKAAGAAHLNSVSLATPLRSHTPRAAWATEGALDRESGEITHGSAMALRYPIWEPDGQSGAFWLFEAISASSEGGTRKRRGKRLQEKPLQGSGAPCHRQAKETHGEFQPMSPGLCGSLHTVGESSEGESWALVSPSWLMAASDLRTISYMPHGWLFLKDSHHEHTPQ